MKKVDVGDYSLLYLNVIMSRKEEGKISLSKFKQYQETLHRWSLRYYDWLYIENGLSDDDEEDESDDA